MRAFRLIPLLFLVLAAALPSASAHLTVSATAPKAPLPVGSPTAVDVTVRVSCADLQSEYNGSASLNLALTDDHPAWLNYTGDKITIATSDCNPQTVSESSSCSPAPNCAADYPYASKSGKINLIPGAGAPAFKKFEAKVLPKGETGTPGVISFTVAYLGTLEATAEPATVPVGLGQNVTFTLKMRSDTNAKSMIMFNAKDKPAAGEADEPPLIVDVMPPAEDNLMYRDVEVPFVYHAPMTEFTSATYTVSVQLMAYDDASKVTAPTDVTWTFTHDASLDPVSADKGGKSPGPEFGLIVLMALGGLYVWRRRGTA